MAEGDTSYLIVEQLKLLRGDVRDLAIEQKATNARLDQTNARLDQSNARLDHLEQTINARFEVVETTLRDLAQQLTILARGVHTMLQHRRDVDTAIEELRARVAALEEKTGT